MSDRDTTTDTEATATAVLLLGILSIIFGPLLAIWAWNTLFGSLLLIPYTLETWCAIVIVKGLLQIKVSR
jgi:hypothetical protein